MFRKQIFFRHYEDAWQKVFISTQDKYCACNANEQNEEKNSCFRSEADRPFGCSGTLSTAVESKNAGLSSRENGSGGSKSLIPASREEFNTRAVRFASAPRSLPAYLSQSFPIFYLSALNALCVPSSLSPFLHVV